MGAMSAVGESRVTQRKAVDSAFLTNHRLVVGKGAQRVGPRREKPGVNKWAD